MKRTTVFLPEELHERLRREAFDRRLSMAQIIRARLEEGSPRPRRSKKDALAKAVGIVKDGSLTHNIDEALYSR